MSKSDAKTNMYLNFESKLASISDQMRAQIEKQSSRQRARPPSLCHTEEGLPNDEWLQSSCRPSAGGRSHDWLKANLAAPAGQAGPHSPLEAIVDTVRRPLRPSLTMRGTRPPKTISRFATACAGFSIVTIAVSAYRDRLMKRNRLEWK